MISEGELVPKFELEDADGKLVKSSELKGKKYVVYFYPRDFTPGYVTKIITNETLNSSLKKKGKLLFALFCFRTFFICKCTFN